MNAIAGKVREEPRDVSKYFLQKRYRKKGKKQEYEKKGGNENKTSTASEEEKEETKSTAQGLFSIIWNVFRSTLITILCCLFIGMYGCCLLLILALVLA